MFDTVLVANRGEIAVRVIATLRRMGIRSVAVYSDADADARHVREADTAVRLGPAAARESYLSIERILDAARVSGAQAVHPGYGFLAENAAFARACADAGLVFVGPPPSAIDAMGDKIRAKRTVEAAGVPVVPGRSEPGLTDDDLVAAATEIGFPVLLKPSAGGGGKGMRLVTEAGQLADAIAGARREAASAFGDDTLLLERFVSNPRHIEIQVLADAHGEVVHLGERECSLQRRHQKIIEEAPSPFLDEETRQRLGAHAVRAARSVGYVGAGTVEFIAAGDDASGHQVYFMEMNTRLQVEHPVTELVTGLDLVELQLRVAAGERLPLSQEDVRLTGHAVEARIYAEDPARNFLPTGGTVLRLREPDGVRVDSGLVEGQRVSSDYDPMLAKYVAHGATRDEALRRLRDALSRAEILGVTTNIPFLRALLADEDVVAGRLDTGLVERRLDQLVRADLPDEVLVAAAMERALALEPSGPVVDPWDVPGGWRIGEPAWATWRIETADRPAVEVRVRGRAANAEVVVGDAGPEPARARWQDGDLLLTYRGRVRRFGCARDGDVTWLGEDGHTWALTETERLAAARHETAASGGPVTSPMPGTVLVVKVAAGDAVVAGQPLLIVEAMKMEHTITAPVDGVVSELHVRAGQSVGLGQPLAVVAPHEEA
ncbi:acetyl-CoA/propionyl-CoA carboxylase, biotin carboxylase, biotin carboxyl carrier protein [Streptoalloteichus tenebrarius]|uniref:biotin carboxylase n=1 Tax=Streptoalloteichus tenebrarius (strain ATCC 17920 / DSM 40477 / JCM 4838 / CBS 697.72 / NBRC 16177 / NCIMB 11028 / NRRL B-12390 / A12253. 1 / ISP 5477) TaxID=1933 RepID=A0ABT1I245_STRSD|nr:acetyl/propionyl/methylcrotonyl-CoA carboxylase subunit alpha [Streptoalloteichus tenebrarius]MCP2261862.1 acetyl-CoA/propionyl-CoA carboxylase, biotin carboxylase, biotin carboxyl carrier protein [Streptoalloteichus tenebrarius]BFF00010.1 acetyl-CoA carboxylase biotin carboxylase subunit [Streptoalloteichus tenebrarius]